MDEIQKKILIIFVAAIIVMVHDKGSGQILIDHNWRTAEAYSSGGFVEDQLDLVLDEQDRPHVVFLDGGVRFGFWDGRAWVWDGDPLPQTAAGISFPALALDDSGRPHVAYVDGTGVFYTTQGGSGWEDPVEIVSGDLPEATELAFADGVLHFSVYVDGSLTYRRLVDGGWQEPERPVPDSDAGFDHDLDLTSDGTAAIVYSDLSSGGLFYIARDADGWGAPEALNPNQSGGENIGLTHDPGGSAAISYVTEGQLWFATNASGDWETQLVFDGGPAGFDSVTQIVIFPDGTPGISYYDNTGPGTLRFIRRLDGNWEGEPEFVDRDTNVGGGNAMAIDSLGRPQIVYQDFDNGALKYSIWNLPPIADAESYRVGIDAPIVSNVLSNDVDPDGFPLTANLLAGPEHGCLTLAGSGRFEYLQFGEGYTGSDSFTYEACDNGGLCAPAAVSITIYVPTLIFEKGTEWWAHRADGSRISLRLAGAPSTTWAGVQQRNATSGQWETVKAPDGEEAWHGTADRVGERPWEQSWWVDQSLLATGPYRWVVYSGEGGYARVYSEPFTMPERAGRTLMLEGPASSATLCETK